MARAINRLSARRAATEKAPGLHADGAGLYLKVTRSGSKSWTFIYRFADKRCEMGLGSLLGTSLADAREKRSKARVLLDDGVDPRTARNDNGAEQADTSFGTVATQLLDGLEAGWRNAKHRQQWRNTLARYAAPIWDKDVAAIDANDLIKVLTPIWSDKPETANRVRGRIERVLDAARVRGFREGDNPAVWRNNLSLLLPARKGKGQGQHHPAMPFVEVPAFMARLKARPATAARALEFTILTAARTSETLKATWSEFDLSRRLWTIAADRMKAGKEHRVPLSRPAMEILRALAQANGTAAGDYVFPGAQADQPLSNMSMAMLLRRMDVTNATVHGFRSSFRDWVGETTPFPREIAEAALAHAVGNEVERAYRRGDALERRRALMEAWSAYLS